MAVNPSRWGTRIGPRLAMLMAQGVVYAHSKLIHVKHKLAMAVFHAISDEISEEVDVTLGPLLQKLHDETPEDHPAYPAIHFLHTATGQLKAIAGTGLQISGLLGSVATVMNNELAPIVYTLIARYPTLIPDPGTVSNMAAAGLLDPNEAKADLNKLGYDDNWANGMMQLAKSWPSVPDILDMIRRGLINNNDAFSYLAYNGVPSELAGKYLALTQLPVSVADAALAVLRGNISNAEGVAIAAENGYSESNFNILIGNTGEPPGLMQLLEGYRRGFIDQATLKDGILQSRYRNEWIPLLEQLRYEPMSVADAVNAVVQAQMDMATGEKIADENGLTPGAFQTLYNTAGEPLSRTEVEELFNRGLMSEAEVIQALRESRLKNKYNEHAFELHQKIIPIYTIERALRYGGIGHSDAVRIAMESGYSETDATTIVNSGSAQRMQTYRDKVVVAVQALYEDNIIPQAKAVSIVSGMGYSQTEASFIMQSSEFRREAKFISQVVQGIKAKYLGRHITRNEAIGLIDKAGIQAAQRDYLMSLWDVEYGAYTKMLTEAQVQKAVKLQLIAPAAGLDRLIAMGYSETDAALLIEGA